MTPNELRHDGGYNSRKLHFGFGLCVLMCVSTFFVPPAAVSDLMFGLVSVYGIYCGANSAVKWAASRMPGGQSAAAGGGTQPNANGAVPAVSPHPVPPRGEDGQELG